MERFSKTGGLLLAGMMAVCALALPATSSAASWGVIGTEHTLHGAFTRFSGTHPVLGSISVSCVESTFTVDVRSAAALTVTATSFTNCTAGGPGIGDCTATPVGTPSPRPDWTVTGPTTSSIQIHGVRINVFFENKPGASACVGANNTSATVTGTLTGGFFVSLVNLIAFNNVDGLTAQDSSGFSFPLSFFATLVDTSHTLTLT